MFKVFNRGHNKVQFNRSNNKNNTNELSSNTSINKIKNVNLAYSYDHIRRRNSVRSTSVFGDADIDSIGRSNLTASNKKYVSCDNFARQFEDDYQEVIDEEFDEETSFKHKLLKPYNSVTNLLMRSFRKARIKKKKEAMLQESFIDENEIPTIQIESKSKPVSRRESVYMDQQEETNQDENKNDNNDSNNYNKADESVPVFKGARLISNEFVDYNITRNNKESAANTSKKENIKIIKRDESFSDNTSNKKPVNPVASIHLNSESKKTPKSGSHIKSKQVESVGKIEQSSAIEVLQKFSSHMKPQAPKPPEPATTSTITEPSSSSSKLSSPLKSIEQEPTVLPLAQINTTNKPDEIEVVKKSAVVKRSKTFTQQLQDMLKDHRISRPELANESPTIQDKKLPNKQLEKSFVASVISSSDVDKSMKANSNTNISHMTSSLIIDSSNMTRLNTTKHELSQDYFDLMDDVNFQFKSINDFNKMQLTETNSINDDDYLIEQQQRQQQKTDEFKDLIQVLSRQETEFKKKFFDCLMSKLWDPALPMHEYVQLNKLMAALFGENYHKIDSGYNTLVKNTDYLNFKSTKNSQVDAEYIVNLMKVYLDSKSSRVNIMMNAYDEALAKQNTSSENDLSISNLITSLRNRQKDESLLLESNSATNRHITPRSAINSTTNTNNNNNYQSLISPNLFDLDEKLQLYGNEFSFRNGFSGLNGTKNKAKSSLVLKLNDSKLDDDETYNKESFINHSILEDYSTKTSVINDDLSTSSNHFQRDNKLRKTLINYEKPSTPSSQLSNTSISEELLKNKRLTAENKIGKIIQIKRMNINSPLNMGSYSASTTTNENTSINNEISIIANNITKLNLSNLSDDEPNSSIVSYSTKLVEQNTNKMNKIASFQPDPSSNLKLEQIRTKSEKIHQKPSFNVVRTVVQPPKPKIASVASVRKQDDYLNKQNKFKVVNILKNVNENLKHASPYVSTTASMRKRDGQFIESTTGGSVAAAVGIGASHKYIYHKQTKEEPIYQVQKMSKHAEFNPIGSISKSIRVYLEEKNSKSLNHLNEDYMVSSMPMSAAKMIQASLPISQQQLRFNRATNFDYPYEPIKKVVSHHLKDLMTDKFYKFERKEMQQAFY